MVEPVSGWKICLSPINNYCEKISNKVRLKIHWVQLYRVGISI